MWVLILSFDVMAVPHISVEVESSFYSTRVIPICSFCALTWTISHSSYRHNYVTLQEINKALCAWNIQNTTRWPQNTLQRLSGLLRNTPRNRPSKKPPLDSCHSWPFFRNCPRQLPSAGVPKERNTSFAFGVGWALSSARLGHCGCGELAEEEPTEHIFNLSDRGAC